MRLLYVICIALFLLIHEAASQSYAFGIKAGPTVGMQRIDGAVNNDPLIQYHGIVFIESANEESSGSLFAELGYHIKGRAERFRSGINFITGAPQDAFRLTMKYQNISLSVGGRQRFISGGGLNAFYLFGLRAEYNLAHEFQIYEGLTSGVNKFVYGVNLGGGLEFPFGEYVSGIFEVRLSPDISRQIFVPPSEWDNPITGQRTVFREQSVRNIALEVSVGFRFLHKVILVDY